MQIDILTDPNQSCEILGLEKRYKCPRYTAQLFRSELHNVHSDLFFKFEFHL